MLELAGAWIFRRFAVSCMTADSSEFDFWTRDCPLPSMPTEQRHNCLRARYHDWRGQEISARERYVAEVAVHKSRKKMRVESERLRVLRLSACEPQLFRTRDKSCISSWDHRGLSSDSDKHFGCPGIEASADCELGIESTPLINSIQS